MFESTIGIGLGAPLVGARGLPAAPAAVPRRDTAVLPTGTAVRVRDAATTLALEVATCAGWTGEQRATALGCVRAAEAALAQARAHLLVATRDRGDLDRPGDRSFEGALARSTRSATHEATRQVRQADTLITMPAVAAAVGDLRVPLGHLDTLARITATAAPEVATALRAPQTQDHVVQMAASMSAPDFATSLAQLVAAQDPAAVEVAFEAQRRERFLTLSTQPHGTFLKGRLDSLAAQSLRIALDLMGQHPDPDRTTAQASADALTLLAEHACTGSTTGAAATAGRAGSVSRPHLSLLVPAETFVELLRHQHATHPTNPGAEASVPPGPGPTPEAGPAAGTGPGAGRAAGTGPARPIAPALIPPWSTVAPWRPVPPATLEDGTPVPMSELARALCDADITRIVMSAEGMPLDVGRTKRLFTPAQRRAAIARDQQCTWNGCTTVASRCEMHHLRWWDTHHGTTSLPNAGLLCAHHHRLVHQLHLTAQRLAQPPGWTKRQQIDRRPIPPATPGINGTPMRYTFRDPTGRTINAPDRSPTGPG